jgi:hypothetical protein
VVVWNGDNLSNIHDYKTGSGIHKVLHFDQTLGGLLGFCRWASQSWLSPFAI